ncbi:hypothetical protein V0U79_11945 [Hyphobacterium sp. HN65]|uniref:Uncharacterized protein n=1 Tax=Hyphobacterium lacteum TaxID=3116575 RepID=A0ABU7LT35_9PROT|nr:hypothetical protein [Hyphobacterium sp. HN65]MEE2527082.1 hypothetical protein [Hyphobacterium sp. HN65]
MNRLIVSLAFFTGTAVLLGFFILPALANSAVGYRVILPGVLYFIFGFGLLAGAFWTWRLVRPASRPEQIVLGISALSGLAFGVRMVLVTFG